MVDTVLFIQGDHRLSALLFASDARTSLKLTCRSSIRMVLSTMAAPKFCSATILSA